jgi:cyclopropane-fatty-acyl-phospholipid synthase
MQKFFLNKLFGRIEGGSFAVKYWDGSVEHFGEGESKFTLILNKPLPEKEIINDPALFFGEAYMGGDIDYEGDLRAILDLVFKNKDMFEKESKVLGAISKLIPKSPNRNRKDIKYHYDIGNDFYGLWLDESMTYSCAYFEQPDNSLYQAQMNKVDYLLKKLNLKEGQTLLDIGSGWGELIIRAAKQYGVKSLGVTLSEEQVAKSKQRIKDEGLEGQVDVKLQDYRELASSGVQFDRLVSVGMLEHVGRANIPDFTDAADSLLKDGGVFVLHTITKQVESESNAWMERYIFPGGYIPSIRELVATLPEHDFYIKDMESLRLHYARTLKFWADSFEKNLDAVRKKFDEPFIRMCQVYLNSCIYGFRYRVVDLHQLILEKGINNELPMTRHYLY